MSGKRFYTPEKVRDILKAQDRQAAGVTALLLRDLFLKEILYK